MQEVQFLTPNQVIDLHAQAVERFGGTDGIRDAGLLESAVLAPQQTFDGRFLYKDIYAMAAALWHGIVSNHPFIDGKQTHWRVSRRRVLTGEWDRTDFEK